MAKHRKQMEFCYSHLTCNIFNLYMRRFFFGLVYNLSLPTYITPPPPSNHNFLKTWDSDCYMQIMLTRGAHKITSKLKGGLSLRSKSNYIRYVPSKRRRNGVNTGVVVYVHQSMVILDRLTTVFDGTQ